MSEREASPQLRAIALDLLARVEAGAHLDAILGSALEQFGPGRDAGLLTRLVYGVETWRKRLDWTIEGLAGRSVDRLDRDIRIALRLGLLQIFLLDRIPPHAAVDTSVELVKRRHPGGAKLVNAVLRRALREGERPLPGDLGSDARCAVEFSHPQWLVERWRTELGAERIASLLAANNEPGPSSFRVDLRQFSREHAIDLLAARGVRGVAHPLCETALDIEGPVSALAGMPGLAPQSVASQLVAALVAPGAGERILDLCAAPGGKAAAIAERSTAGGRVFAADRARGGTRRIGERRRGREALLVLRADGTRPPLTAGTFDAVLVDAPCSGLGTLRAHPEMRWRRGPGDVKRLAHLQAELLDAAADLLRPGGRLIYATCTLLREENEDNVAAFRARHPGFDPIDPRPILGAAAGLVGDDLALRTAPDVGSLDGFFAVVLRKDPGSV